MPLLSLHAHEPPGATLTVAAAASTATDNDNDHSVVLRFAAPDVASCLRACDLSPSVTSRVAEAAATTARALLEFHFEAVRNAERATSPPTTDAATLSDAVSRVMDDRMTRLADELRATREAIARDVAAENARGLATAVADARARDPYAAEIREVRDVAVGVREDVAHLRRAADARAVVAGSSALKGREAERTLASVLGRVLLEENGWSLRDTTKEPHSCDLEVSHTTGPTVLVESKCKDRLSKDDVAKFLRDLGERNSHGVLVSLKCPVPGRRRGAVFERQDSGKFAAFLYAERFDEYADCDIDVDAVIGAIRALHVLHAVSAPPTEKGARGDDCDGDNRRTLTADDLAAVGEEVARAARAVGEVREQQHLVCESADLIRRRATRTIEATRDLEWRRVKTVVLNVGAVSTADADRAVATGGTLAAAAADVKVYPSLQCDVCTKTFTGRNARSNLSKHAARCPVPI